MMIIIDTKMTTFIIHNNICITLFHLFFCLIKYRPIRLILQPHIRERDISIGREGIAVGSSSIRVIDCWGGNNNNKNLKPTLCAIPFSVPVLI